jgi:ribose transport system substrate-binding protein
MRAKGENDESRNVNRTLRRRSIHGAAAFGAIALATLVACTQQADKTAAPASAAPVAAAGAKKYHFAFVTNNSSDFWKIAAAGVRKAEVDFGVKAEMFIPLKGEVSDQQHFLEDILVQDFNGVAISPLTPDSMTSLLDRVADKMPLVCHDSDAPKSKRKSYIGTNNVVAGRAAGEAGAAALKAAGITKGKVAIFVGRIDVANAAERKQGVEEVLSKNPALDILPVFLDGTDRSKAKKNVEDALVRYPDLVLTIGLWSYNGGCLSSSIGASARAKKPIIISFDEEEETLKAVQDGIIDSTIVQKPFEFGYQSMKLLKDLADGKSVPAVVDPGILVVRKDNLKEFWDSLRELKK